MKKIDKKVKKNGVIYTPDYLVSIILDQGGYVCDNNIIDKHVIDNSCGDGQFMVQVVDRFCRAYKNDDKISQLKNALETYVHAIEIDDAELAKCMSRCDEVAAQYGIEGVKWDFICKNSLEVHKYDGKMDYVVGNPPYVRVHNIESLGSVKEFKFNKNGMTDLYIAFYEIGLDMLSKDGVLSYITPSSFFTSIAGREMRDYLLKHNLIDSICDLKHFKAFNATTYTAIVCLKNGKKTSRMKYSEFNSKKKLPYHVDDLDSNDYVINGLFYFSKKTELNRLKVILENKNSAGVHVKNGYATLADKLFIKNFDFDSKYILPIIKASTGKWTKMFYPYNNKSKIIEENELKEDKKLYDYLIKNKEQFLDRSNEKGDEYWYVFGRSQGVNDTYKEKISLNALVKTKEDVKTEYVPAGSGVYSGFYITTVEDISLDDIQDKLKSDEFVSYISMLGKYKSGGYYTYSSKDVKAYLDYVLTKNV